MNTSQHKQIFSVSLTGGIGCGKSTAAHYFAQLNVPIIDADKIARTCTQPGSTTLKAIIKHFGSHFLDADGQLNRTMLGIHIFQDTEARHWLEQQLHPLIHQHIHTLRQTLSTPYCLLVIPLLIESASDYQLDRILVIDAPEYLQHQRIMQRDNQNPTSIQRIIQAQATREQRLALADDVIINDSDKIYLKRQVCQLHQRYLISK